MESKFPASERRWVRLLSARLGVRVPRGVVVGHRHRDGTVLQRGGKDDPQVDTRVGQSTDTNPLFPCYFVVV